ncbi:MAG: FAD-dependent oxidoreductase [Deltaproteobacteria bacterium]|jgi:predicted oxidoreductase|nr:FAD-dependent oxidoreductase [Deltaproteobacteria bacterium]MDA8308386.1 FAD-dependent oxidoreductase [Deltaproteobacteria bacterium]
MRKSYQTDVVIAGAGLAGIVTAYELLDRGRKVLLIDKDERERFGGLAKESFGGVHFIGTPFQKRLGIKDSPELAYRDWQSFACFGENDHWPRAWAKFYCEHSIEYIFNFLQEKKVKFLPLVNWAERGLFSPGNSVPRWHIAWGTGAEIIRRLIDALDAHPKRRNLELLFDHEVDTIETTGGSVSGVAGKDLAGGEEFRAAGEVVVASGGICGGDLGKVRANWCSEWGAPPQVMLNGAHLYADGLLHDKVASLGGNITHLDKQWHYAAGVHHPARRKIADGLSLVPPRSALWMNALGERIGPLPLIGYTDTRWLVESIVRQPGGYSWQVLNRKIAARELAVSGCDYMTAFAKKSRALLLKQLLFGNNELVERLLRECPQDFIAAGSLPELVEKMNERSLFGLRVDLSTMERDITCYDEMIDRGRAFFDDEQLRRIGNHRGYLGDRLRTCKFQKILDPGVRPLIAIREFILSRKSLGGIQTDLRCRVLNRDGAPIDGLYAVGEAAGFGGGGIHGLRSLEGTFLGSCVLTGRIAGRTIAGE